MRSTLIILLFGLASFIPARAEIIRIPDDFATIQGAINAAEPTDTLIVEHGEYVENIDFMGKGLIVGSLFFLERNPAHIENTVIDGDGDGPVVQFTRGERGQLVGFTLRNGVAPDRGGGGVYCSGSSPSLMNLVIEDCAAARGGGNTMLGKQRAHRLYHYHRL